jgi:hypothetical protein
MIYWISAWNDLPQRGRFAGADSLSGGGDEYLAEI